MSSGYLYVAADGRLLPLEDAPDTILRGYAAMRDSEDEIASGMAAVASEELKRRQACGG